MKDITRRFVVDGDNYGITADGEIYSLLKTVTAKRIIYRIGYHIDDRAGYSYVWNRLPMALKSKS